MDDSYTAHVPASASFTTCLAYSDTTVHVRPATKGGEVLHLEFGGEEGRIWANVTLNSDQARTLRDKLVAILPAEVA